MDPRASMAAVSLLSSEYLVVLVAVVTFFFARSRLRPRAGASGAAVFPRGVVLVAGLMGCVANVAFLLPLSPLPVELPPGVLMARGPLQVLPAWAEYATVPAVGVVVQLLFLLAAVSWVRRSRPVGGRLDPRPRGWWSFLPRGAVATATALLAFLIVTVALTGLVSSSDNLGRFALLRIATPNGSGETLFPGWYYTVPVLVAVAVLVPVGLTTLVLLARPPSAADHDDSARRRGATQLAAAVLAFLMMTLGRPWIFAALGGVGAARVDADGGSAWIVTSFQAVTPVLGFAGAVLAGLGLALSALLIFPVRARVDTTVEAHP